MIKLKLVEVCPYGHSNYGDIIAKQLANTDGMLPDVARMIAGAYNSIRITDDETFVILATTHTFDGWLQRAEAVYSMSASQSIDWMLENLGDLRVSEKCYISDRGEIFQILEV